MYHRLEFLFHGIISLNLLILSFLTQFLSGSKDNSPYHECKDLRGKIVIITGSNTGIGKQTALQLTSFGATVVIACRNIEKGNEAKSEIETEIRTLDEAQYPHSSQGKVFVMKLDLTELVSVINFSKEFKKSFERLDILINNAGLNTKDFLPNGIQQLFQVNYLGHYLLVRSLLDLLTKTPNNISTDQQASFSTSRVVNLSSVMHHNGQANFKRSAFSKYTPALKSNHSYYSDSKLYMNLMTLELNRRFNSTGNSPKTLLALSANPGAVSSDIWRSVAFKSIFDFITSLLFISVKEGCATSVYGATIEEKAVYDFRSKYNSNKPGKLHFSRDIPYFIPYNMPFPLMAFEQLGKFAGAQFARVTLPDPTLDQEHLSDLEVAYDSPETLAKSLWDYSGELCYRLLLDSGIDRQTVEFLI